MTTYVYFEHGTERLLYIYDPSFLPRIGETVTIEKGAWRVRSINYEYANGDCKVTIKF